MIHFIAGIFVIWMWSFAIGLISLTLYDHYGNITRKTTMWKDIRWCVAVGYFVPIGLCLMLMYHEILKGDARKEQ